MLARQTTHSLQVTIDTYARAAWIELVEADRHAPSVVSVTPATSGGGWSITDSHDPEPVWRASFEAALHEAIGVAGRVLGDRLARELGAGRRPPIRLVPPLGDIG